MQRGLILSYITKLVGSKLNELRQTKHLWQGRNLGYINMVNMTQKLRFNFFINSFITFFISIATSVALHFIVLANLTKFRNSKIVFINSYAFGHSIIEASAFFRVYNKSSICISVGHRKNRNKYFKYIYEPQILIHFWLPYFRINFFNHALRKRVHSTILNDLNNSWLLRIIIGRNIVCIERDSILDKGVVNDLISNYLYSEKHSRYFVEKFKSDFEFAKNKHSSSLQFLMQKKNLLPTNLPDKFNNYISKFEKKIQNINSQNLHKENKVCTIIFRKSEKVWTGLGIEGYGELINYLNDNNYIVNVIGDFGKKEYKSWKQTNNSRIYTHKDYGLNSRIFQILSVKYSDFCLGDPSGAQVIPQFFSKKNLTFNVTPIGQFQYNTIVVPKVWMKNGLKCSIDEHLNDLLFRYKPLKSQNGDYFSSHFLPKGVMLKALKYFIDGLSHDKKMFEKSKDFNFISDFNSLLFYSDSSTISSAYIEYLDS
jgi:hypothetical protein